MEYLQMDHKSIISKNIFSYFELLVFMESSGCTRFKQRFVLKKKMEFGKTSVSLIFWKNMLSECRVLLKLHGETKT
jgi:hypothetical protein